MSIDLVEFNRDLRSKIPSLRLLGIEFIEASDLRVRLKVPFAPNKNHMETAFGGSIYLAATTACYGLFRAMTIGHTQANEYIILKRGQIDYLKPITANFEVIAERESKMEVEQMLAAVAKVGHSKLEISSRVVFNGNTCASYKGLFVLRRK